MMCAYVYMYVYIYYSFGNFIPVARLKKKVYIDNCVLIWYVHFYYTVFFLFLFHKLKCFFFVDYQFTKFQVVFQKKKSIDVIPKCIHCNFNPLKYNLMIYF